MNSSSETKRFFSKAHFLIPTMCIAEVLGMLGVFAFPALLPFFLKLWSLSNNQAGWISGIYFVSYTVAVPLLTALTDRFDARRIYLIFCSLGVLSNLGFAFLARDFYSALLFRALSGLGLAGTFIPGLKAIIDRLDPPAHARAISFYTACFGMGMSISFYLTGKIFRQFGWEAVFDIAAAGSFLSLILAFEGLTPKKMPQPLVSKRKNFRSVFDFYTVWRNKLARAYIFAYMCHMWEMFAVRSWMVAFLSFTITLQKDPADAIAPTTVMALAGIGGMLASIVGAELAIRFGRQQIVTLIMGISFILALGIGFSAQLPYSQVVVLCLIYTLFFQGDSAAIHAGVIIAADTEHRGATMALQSLSGFAAASLGTVVAGVVLDISGGGSTPLSWGITFGTIGIVAASGPIWLHRNRRSLVRRDGL